MEKLNDVDFEAVIGRFGFLALGVLFLFIPFAIYGDVGYSGPFYIFLEFVIAIVGCLFILYSTLPSYNLHLSKKVSKIIVLFALVFVSSIVIIIGIAVKPIYTDELAIEALAAKRMLEGLNPYGYHFGLSALSAYGVPVSSLTPTISGGYVSTLQYPDLMILLLAPLVYFHLDPGIVLFLFTTFLIAIIAYEFIERDLLFMVPLAVAIAFFNVNLLLFSYEGITDIVWVTFLALSIVFLQKRYIPGIFLGLSIAAKQLPIFIIPFLIIFIYKKYGLQKLIEVVSITALTFIAVNLPFIIANPGVFFSAVIAPESTPILGIGFGLSQIYFSGYLPFADREFFTILMLSVWAFLIILYLYKFEKLKYSFTVFPIIIVMFNFRLLENYLMYWPVITLVTIPYIFRKGNQATEIRKTHPTLISVKNKFKRNILRNHDLTKFYRLFLLIIIVIIVVTPIYAFMENERLYKNQIVIRSATLSGINPSGFADSMMINVSYGPEVTNTSFNFRILEDGFLNNPNGFFWESTAVANNSAGGFTVYHLYTNDSSYYLEQNNSYIIIAYNQYVETWYHILVGKSILL